MNGPVSMASTAIKFLFAACAWCMPFPALSDDLPFEGGWYVPETMRDTCKDPNYQVYDWVLGFDPEKGTFGGSDGSCKARTLTFDEKTSSYRADWSCSSTDGDEEMTLLIKTDGPRGRVLAIDGEPYARCEPLPR